VTLVHRLGLALVNPRSALAAAGDRNHAGRSGTDLLVALIVFIFATQLRGLVKAGWLGSTVNPGLGLRALVALLTDALVIDLCVLILSAVIIWVVSGRRREAGRAFDLACVAVLPLLFVDLAGSIAIYAADVVLPRGAMIGLSVIAYAWTGVLVALAALEGRRPSRGVATTKAGWLLVALAIAGIAVQTLWLVRNPDRVRPMQNGQAAPALALPRIEASGAFGPTVTLTPGKITILDFWATWCSPCLRAMPKLDAFARRHPEIAVIAIAIDEPADARSLFDEKHWSPTLVAGDRETSERYGVESIPHTVLIDREGVVRHVFRGGDIDLEREIELLK